jgi:replicative DNA helicase
MLRVPPHSIEAEQSVIGALLLDNAAFDKLGELRADEFFNDAHRALFEVMQAAWHAGQTFDAVTISEALKSANKLDYVGGLGYIGALQNAVPSAANAARYSVIVRDRAKRRGLMAVGVEVSDLGDRGDGTADEVIAEAQARIAELAERGTAVGFVPFSEALTVAADRSTDPSRRALQGLMPNDHLERIMGGCEPGSLIIVAARPSVGKTVFGQQAAIMAARRGFQSAFFSLEMPAEQLAMRALSAWSNVPLAEIREGKADRQSGIVVDAMCRLAALPIKVDDSGGLHINQILARSRALHRRHKVGLIVVDYLTMVRGDGDKTTDRVGDVAQKLKTLAKELNCVVMALSQMSRECEKRTDKRGQLSDLRDSGEIEQAADVVIFLHRDELYDPNTPNKGVIEMIVRKNRHGGLGTAYGNAAFAFSRIDDQPHGFKPFVSATPAPARSRFAEGQDF